MLRLALVLGALALAPAALACEGEDHSNCQFKESTVAMVDDVDAASGVKVELAIDGMNCGKCADNIVTVLKTVDGVNAATVDVKTGLGRVAYDPAKTDVDALITKVSQTGPYTAQLAE